MNSVDDGNLTPHEAAVTGIAGIQIETLQDAVTIAAHLAGKLAGELISARQSGCMDPGEARVIALELRALASWIEQSADERKLS